MSENYNLNDSDELVIPWRIKECWPSIFSRYEVKSRHDIVQNGGSIEFPHKVGLDSPNSYTCSGRRKPRRAVCSIFVPFPHTHSFNNIKHDCRSHHHHIRLRLSVETRKTRWGTRSMGKNLNKAMNKTCFSKTVLRNFKTEIPATRECFMNRRMGSGMWGDVSGRELNAPYCSILSHEAGGVGTEDP